MTRRVIDDEPEPCGSCGSQALPTAPHPGAWNTILCARCAAVFA